MPKSPGRNSLLENVWRTITSFFSSSANVETGESRPGVYSTLFGSSSIFANHPGSDYVEIPIRDALRGRALIELRKNPEISTCLDILADDALSSEDGDEFGIAVAETLDDRVTPVDPVIAEILRAAIKRLFSNTLKTIIDEYLSYGDSFRSLIFSKDYRQILMLKQLPTWEMFRIEDENGIAIQFEQRQVSHFGDPDYVIHPAVCMHWRYRTRYKYGRSLFEEMIDDVISLQRGYSALNEAAINTGYNPNVHIMPDNWTPDQMKAYKIAYENERRNAQRTGKIVSDLYIGNKGDVKKLGNFNPDIKALVDNVAQRRNRLAMRSRIPPWMIGMPTQGARDIAGQPALAYARMIGSIRTALIGPVRTILNTELLLNGIPPEKMEYRLTMPKLYTDTITQSNNSNAPQDENIVEDGGEFE